MNQRHLGRVTAAVEHALAEERPPERYAIKPACEPAAAPGLDAVTMADLVQRAAELADAMVDPCVFAPGLGCRALADDALEGGVDRDVVAIRAHGAREAGGDMEAVEEKDAALLQLDPEQAGIVGALSHREDAAGIGPQQNLGRDFGRCGIARAHGRIVAEDAAFVRRTWISVVC